MRWMLLAQDVVPASTQGWVALIVQTGAIGILGYHLLWGLPRIIERFSVAQAKMVDALMTLFQTTLADDRRMTAERCAEDRRAFGERSGAVVAELTKLKDAVPRDIAPKFEALVKELQHQTQSIDEQTLTLETMAKKMDENPSDWSKVCQAEAALNNAGFNPNVIKKFLAVMQKRKNGQ